MEHVVYRKRIRSVFTGNIDEFLAGRAGLPVSLVREAMEKGAVWVARGRHKERIRTGSETIAAGSIVELYFDEKMLQRIPPEASCISDQRAYSVWRKPSGLLSQGTQFGDHCSLMRQVELHFRPPRQVFLVHRLDREVEGIMLLAHTHDAAEKLSALFHENRIQKTYHALVLGKVGESGSTGLIDVELDGKSARSTYRVEAFLPENNASLVIVTIETGRLHQIRRHFEVIGHPVIGDPKYGKGNKNKAGLQLKAVELGFFCPFLKRDVTYALPEAEAGGFSLW